jgi:hypothetical protein
MKESAGKRCCWQFTNPDLGNDSYQGIALAMPKASPPDAPLGAGALLNLTVRLEKE